MSWKNICTTLLITIFSIAIISSASAQETIVDNAVRVNVGFSYGSGTYIGDGLVLSCSHLYRGEDTQKTNVLFNNGESYTGRLVNVDDKWDQSLIELDRKPDRDGTPIADRDPQPGEIVHAYGYGNNYTLKATTGYVTKYYTNEMYGTEFGWFDMTGTVPLGSSGGPIIDNDGYLIGNLWGSDQTTITGLCTRRTRAFVAPWRNRTSNSVCQDGVCRPPQNMVQPQLPPQQQMIPLPPQNMAPMSDDLPVLPPRTNNSPVIVETPNCRCMPRCPGPQCKFDANAVANILKNDPEFIAKTKGEPGQDGQPGPQGEPGPPGDTPELPPINNSESTWSHLVLIAPSESEYWYRLKYDYEKAEDYYNQIRHVEPPTDRNIGPMPLLVAYSGGKPVKNWIGLRDVSQALNYITRGEYDDFLYAQNSDNN